MTGELLKKFVFDAQENVKIIAENLIYHKSIIMISGDPGVGKSTINANIIRDLSLGVPVFNFFHTPVPVICYYVPFERGAYEVADRLKSLSSVLEPNWANIIIKPDFIGFDMFDQKQASYFVNQVCLDLNYFISMKIQVVLILDPIISMVSGEIKEEKYAKAITRVANQIQSYSNCALILTNHTTKASSGKKKQKVDPFYGSQAFKAFCTSGIYVSKNVEYGGVNMTSTKSSHGNTLEQVHLNYDAFTHSLFAKVDASGMKNYDKVLATIRSIRQMGTANFTFHNVTKHTLCFGVSPTSVKEIILHDEPFKSGIKAITGCGKPTILSFTDKWE
jgi:RecA-family ATPase